MTGYLRTESGGFVEQTPMSFESQPVFCSVDAIVERTNEELTEPALVGLSALDAH